MYRTLNIVIVFFFLIFSYKISGQDIYNFTALPDSLKLDANYIVWEDFVQFDVIDEGKAIESGKMAVLVPNQYTNHFNTVYLPYRKGESVSLFEASIYDVNGKLVKKLKKSEIKDVSSVSDFSLFEDDRLLMAEFTHNAYPYTLLFEYERKTNGLLNYPVNYFQSEEKSMVRKAAFQISVPEGFKFRYKAFNLSGNMTSWKDNKGKEIFRWEESDIMPIKKSDYLPHWSYYQKKLILAPVNFSEGGYSGNLESWKNFGLWNQNVNAGRDQLSEAYVAEIRNLIKDAKSDKEKIKILYTYLQNKTRYVSVQLGIGGYQTFPADYVHTKGYGDCKALSNYMHSLLKLVGINSYYTLVKAGENEDDILTEFPVNQFNHVILCVPQQADTIWLECTSQKQPFNFLGSFTNDRHVLLVTDEGGKLVKTPRYPKDGNTQYRNALVSIDDEGNAKASVNTVFSGLKYENREIIQDVSVKERDEYLNQFYPGAGLLIDKCNYVVNKDTGPSIIENLEIRFPKFASVSSKRMFIKLNSFIPDVFIPKNEDRKIPFQVRSEYIDIDTIRYSIPLSFKLESMPKPVHIESKFGTYSFSVIQDENIFTCIRKLSVQKGTFDATDYNSYCEFKRQINAGNKAKLVFVKKE